MSGRRFAVLTAVLVAGIGASFLLGRMWRPFASTAYREPARPLEEFPLAIGGFSGRDLPLGEQARRAAGMDRWLRREYRSPEGVALVLYVAFYGNRDRGLETIYHNPTVCYPAAGYEPGPSETVDLPAGGGVTGVDFTVYRSPEGRDLLVGSFFVLDEKRVSARAPRNDVVGLGFEKLRPSLSPGYFVQVQAVAESGPDPREAKALLRRFLTAALPELLGHF